MYTLLTLRAAQFGLVCVGLDSAHHFGFVFGFFFVDAPLRRRPNKNDARKVRYVQFSMYKMVGMFGLFVMFGLEYKKIRKLRYVRFFKIRYVRFNRSIFGFKCRKFSVCSVWNVRKLR